MLLAEGNPAMKKCSVILACLALLACNARTGPELVVQKAFEAIQANDWMAYQDIMMTPITFEMQKNKVSTIRQSQTYQDKEFKPRQIENMRRQFDLAIAGCTGCTALQDTDLEQVALVGSSSMESLTGDMLPYDIYQITVEANGETMVVDYPRFVIVNSGGIHHIMGLLLPDEDFEQSMYVIDELEEETYQY